MTINRKIKDYRHTIKWKLIDLKEEANKVAEEIVRNAPDDINYSDHLPLFCRIKEELL